MRPRSGSRGHCTRRASDRGDVVAVLMPNCPAFVHAFFACALLGARALLVNARYKARELAYVLRDADAAAVLTTDVVSEYVDFVPSSTPPSPEPAARSCRVMLGESSPPGFLDRDAFLAAADTVPLEDVPPRRVREADRASAC